MDIQNADSIKERVFLNNLRDKIIAPKNADDIIKKTQYYVEETLKTDCTGHDWWHIHRVYNVATYICQKESGNLLVIQLAALLHDIADWKFHGGNEKAGPEKARSWLNKLDVEISIIDHVCHIIETMSFKGANVQSIMPTLEGKIVQDADRLDALGAIGIARTFAYGGFVGRPLYDPDIKPLLHNSFEEYKKHQGTTLNHFFEKLLLLQAIMNTQTAKQIAKKRHQFMQNYVDEFLGEWNFENNPD